MANRANRFSQIHDTLNEDNLNDTSLYGEFVSTFHHWMSSEELHAKGEYLQQLGNTRG